MRLIKIILILLLVLFLSLVSWADIIAIPDPLSGDTSNPSIGISIFEEISEKLTSAQQLEVQYRTESEHILSKKEQTKHSHLILSWMFPKFSGSAIETLDDEYSGSYSYDLPSNGLDLHLLLDMTNYFYLATSMGYVWQIHEENDNYKADDFSALDFRVSGGMLLPFGGFSSFFLGGGLDYVIFTLDDNLDSGERWTVEGLGICFEGGMDLYLNNLCLSARLNYTFIPQLSTDDFFIDPENLNISAIMFGAGFCF